MNCKTFRACLLLEYNRAKRLGNYKYEQIYVELKTFSIFPLVLSFLSLSFFLIEDIEFLIVNLNFIDNVFQALSFADLDQEVSRYIEEVSLLLQIRKGYGRHLQRLMEDTEKTKSLGGTTLFFSSPRGVCFFQALKIPVSPFYFKLLFLKCTYM